MDWVDRRNGPDYEAYQRLRRGLEQRVSGFDGSETWSIGAVTALLRALIPDLDLGWSGIEVADAYVADAEEFVVVYRAQYIDGLLGIRGSKGMRTCYLNQIDTPESFGGDFVLYLQEPSGDESFTTPDQDGVRWFQNFGEGDGAYTGSPPLLG